MEVNVPTCTITTKAHSLSHLSRWSVQGWHILNKVRLMPGQEGKFQVQQRFISEWKKKRDGQMGHSEFVMEKPAGSTYMISMNFLVPAGKKTKTFYHRLGTCYNFSAYTHPYAWIFSSLVCTPSLVAVRCPGPAPLRWAGACGAVQESGERSVLCRWVAKALQTVLKKCGGS